MTRSGGSGVRFATPLEASSDGYWGTRRLIGQSVYYSVFGPSKSVTAAKLSLNELYAAPFYCPYNTSVTNMLFDVVGPAVTNAVVRFGIYRNSSNKACYPGSLALSTSTVAAATVGAVYSGLGVTLKGGQMYWLAVVAQTAVPNTRGTDAFSQWVGLPGATDPAPQFDSSGSANPGAGAACYVATGVSGALPDPFPSTVVTKGYYPRVWITS